MLDEVVGSLILAAITPSGGDGEWLMRRKAKAFLKGKAVTIPAHLQTDRRKPRPGRLRLLPDADDLEWRPWPQLGRAPIQLGQALGRVPVTRSHSREVPAPLRGPAWEVRATSGEERAVLFLTGPVSRVFAPVLDGGEPPDDEF